MPDLYYKVKIKKIINKTETISNYKMPYILKKEIRSFWSRYSCKKIPLYWHRAYIATNGIEDVRYIPENIFYKKIEPFYNRKELYRAYTDKNTYDRIFHGMEMPLTIIRNINGRYYDKNYKPISLVEAIEVVCSFLPKNERIVIKPSICSGGGKSVKIVSFEKLNKADYEKEIEHLLNTYKKDFIVQEYLHQFEMLGKLHKDSLNTIRCMTFRHI